MIHSLPSLPFSGLTAKNSWAVLLRYKWQNALKVVMSEDAGAMEVAMTVGGVDVEVTVDLNAVEDQWEDLGEMDLLGVDVDVREIGSALCQAVVTITLHGETAATAVMNQSLQELVVMMMVVEVVVDSVEDSVAAETVEVSEAGAETVEEVVSEAVEAMVETGMETEILVDQ